MASASGHRDHAISIRVDDQHTPVSHDFDSDSDEYFDASSDAASGLSSVSGSWMELPTNEEEARAFVMSRVKKQLHFYFGDRNYPTDRFLRKHARASPDSYIPLSVVARYKKMKKITDDIDLIAESMHNSDIVELSPDGTAIRRRHKPPKYTPEDVLSTSVIVTDFNGVDPTFETVRRLMAGYGNIYKIDVVGPSDPVPANICTVYGEVLPEVVKPGSPTYALVEFEYADEALLAVKDNEETQKLGTAKFLVSRVYKKPKRRVTAQPPPKEGEDRDRSSSRGRKSKHEPTLLLHSHPRSMSRDRHSSGSSERSIGRRRAGSLDSKSSPPGADRQRQSVSPGRRTSLRSPSGGDRSERSSSALGRLTASASSSGNSPAKPSPLSKQSSTVSPPKINAPNNVLNLFTSSQRLSPFRPAESKSSPVSPILSRRKFSQPITKSDLAGVHAALEQHQRSKQNARPRPKSGDGLLHEPSDNLLRPLTAQMRSTSLESFVSARGGRGFEAKVVRQPLGPSSSNSRGFGIGRGRRLGF